MAEVLIQGINCHYRDLREGEEILYIDLPQKDQKFKRVEHPFSDDDLVSIATKEEGYQMTASQKEWVEKEEKRMDYAEGVYASINGKLKYLPGSYWGYINYWTLENGKKPDYREADRRFFLFTEYIWFETKVLAETRGKGRRKGATSQGSYLEWWHCGRNEEKIGGMISFNDDAAQAVFQKMFMRGFTEMLPCFVRDFDSSSENFIRFIKPVEKKKKGVPIKRQGLNSYVGYKSNNINSYDSGRVSFGLFDESGKYEKMDINTYWSKVSATLKEGLHKVGFAYFPTTVNPKNKGGENYQIFWGKCNQNAINPKTGEPYGLNTPNKCVRYLDPATEGYAGCIDEYGESVIDDPVEPVMGNDGHWITRGSLSIILEERSLLEGEQLMEHRRDFPLDEFDMFAFTAGLCEFNEENILNQIKDLEGDIKYNTYWRQMRFVPKEEPQATTLFGKTKPKRTIISAMDDQKGGWFILEFPQKQNHFSYESGYRHPLNEMLYQVGVDTTQDRIAVAGSNPAITVFKKSCIIDGVETGLYPVALWVSPTRMDIHFDEQVLYACMLYGCKANYEIDRRVDFYRYFCKENSQSFLTWTPTIMKNPLKPNKPAEYGSRSGDPFQLAQMLQISKWYVDGDSNERYNGHVHRVKHIPMLKEILYYDHLERTKSDLFISLQMALVAVFGEMQMPKKQNYKPTKLLPTYKIKMVS